MGRKALHILPALEDAIDGRPLYVLAAAARVGISDFGRIVQGRQAPTDAQAERIAGALGIGVNVVRQACIAGDEHTTRHSAAPAVEAEAAEQPDGDSGGRGR